MTKTAYIILETVKDNDGGYIPCIVKEGEKGYFKTDWNWGKDIKIAEECANKKNETMGIDKTEAIKLTLQSMR